MQKKIAQVFIASDSTEARENYMTDPFFPSYISMQKYLSITSNSFFSTINQQKGFSVLSATEVLHFSSTY